MTTPAPAEKAPPHDAPSAAPAALSPTRPLYWSVRRELWEHRSLYVAPLAVAAVVLFGFLISTISLPRRVRAVAALDAAQQPNALAMPFSMAASLIIVTTFVVGAFFCIEALYGERRDRSLLFWKSLPVSDRTTVLSKAAIPLVVLPLLAFAIALSTQVTMGLFSTAVLLLSGLDPATLWARVPLVRMSLVMFYGLTVHVLWFAPLFGWLLLVSSWARRTPVLWVVLPPVAISIFERIAFGTSHFAALIGYRLGGALRLAFDFKTLDNIVPLVQPVRFLASPGLWIGLLAAALFLAAAARLRRNREPL